MSCTMSKADNMLAILWLLKSRQRITARQLAEELEINIRTVYRYIDSLCASGVPIIADSGHKGGYSLLPQFTESPLFFDEDEQKALIHAAIFAEEAGYPFGDTLNRAVAKLKHYTNQEQLNKINQHLSGFDVINPPFDSSLESFLQEIELSVAAGKTLHIEYQKGKDSIPTARRVDPYGLVYWKSNWYIVAYCHLREAIRSFRVDRIQDLRKVDTNFHRPNEFSAREFFLESLLPDLNNNENLISVQIQGNPQVLNDLCEHWLLGYALKERSGDYAHFRLEEESVTTYVPYFLLPYGKAIQVKEPALLKKRLATITLELHEHYKN